MAYQDLHWELERWSIFRLLPQLIKFDRTLIEWQANVQKGTVLCPDFHE